MKWFPLKKAVWPVDEMPSSYFTVYKDSPDLGAVNAILASLTRTIIALEQRVNSLEKQVSDLQGWP